MKRRVVIGVVGCLCISILQCCRSFSSADYFPLRLGFSWQYRGLIHSVTVSEVHRYENEDHFTVMMNDSSGNVLCKEKYVRRGKQIYWKSFSTAIATIPNIYFEPAIPISPIGNKIGDTQTLSIVERRDIGSACHVRVTCTIEEVGRLQMGIDNFEGIKMHIKYECIDEARSMLEGDTYYWYVKNIGIVKYSMPSGEGELRIARLEQNLSLQ